MLIVKENVYSQTLILVATGISADDDLTGFLPLENYNELILYFCSPVSNYLIWWKQLHDVS